MTTGRFSASGFQSVDHVRDGHRFVEYLDAQAATPFWRDAKADTVSALGLSPGDDALDLGCGVGDEVRKMAESARTAVGVDASRLLVEEAHRRTDPGLQGVRFEQARAEALPFEDGSFDKLRVERTLQHVEDLPNALAELWRVARPGARLVALEPDWDTLVFDAGPLSATRAVRDAWVESIANPLVGRQLARRLRKLGATDVTVEPRTAAITEWSFANEQYGLTKLVPRALSPAAARGWLSTLEERDREGTFLAAATYFLVVATKPGG